MHVGIANPWWRGNIPVIPGACATRNFAYLVRGPWGVYCECLGEPWSYYNGFQLYIFPCQVCAHSSRLPLSIMAGRTQWYYKPTNSPRYPGVRPRDAFLTEYKALTAPVPGRRSLRSPEEQRAFLERMSKPTVSSSAKFDFPSLSFTYQNRYLTWDGRFLWNRMDYLRDHSKCLWSRHGAVKHGYQLRC